MERVVHTGFYIYFGLFNAKHCCVGWGF